MSDFYPFSKIKSLSIGSFLLFGLVSLMLTFSCTEKTDLFANEYEAWDTFGDADWTLENGELTGTVKDTVGFLMTKASYTDFILELEFKPDSTINSGIYIRCQNKEISFTDCYEINIWDLHPNQDNRTGSVVNRAKPLEIVETIDKWNSYKIKIEGNHVEAWINGIKTVDLQNDDLKEGYIALQAMGTGVVSFRNVKIETIDAQ